MTRILLDLFCGAGGAGFGYAQAGFAVIGVDNKPQPNYPFQFIRCDALEYLDAHGSRAWAIHASPPCQAHSALTKGSNGHLTNLYPEYIPAVRKMMTSLGRPGIIENVMTAPIRQDIVLCGEMFGLKVIRHRAFELIGWTMPQPEHLLHRGMVHGNRHGVFRDGYYYGVHGRQRGTITEWREAMGMLHRMTREEIKQAIPPAYTRLIGTYLA